jgi:hypothetical protein
MKQIFWPLALFATAGLVLALARHRDVPAPPPTVSAMVAVSPVMHSYQVPKDPYVVPRDGALHRMQITVTDAEGTRVVYDNQCSGGEKVQACVRVPGSAVLRFYDNDALKGEAAL